MTVALLIAALLGRPAGIVSTIYDIGGIDMVCLVEYESQFNDRACRREAKGGTSWGLFQLWDKYHEQHRDDLLLHIVTGASFWAKCKEKGRGNIAVSYSWYNSWGPRKSIAKGLEVQAIRDRLASMIAITYGLEGI